MMKVESWKMFQETLNPVVRKLKDVESVAQDTVVSSPESDSGR